MAITRLRMHVELEDGKAWDVDTDQRDLAKFEMQDFYRPDRFLLKQRFAAYVASVRTGNTDLSWPKFDKACVEVIAADAGEQSLDPTSQDQPDDPSFT